jgi:N-methylhydantoinase A
LPRLDAQGGAPVANGKRPVYFDGAFRDTPIYRRGALAPGARIAGPAIVEEFGSTTVVFPGQHLEVDPHGILIIRAQKTDAMP